MLSGSNRLNILAISPSYHPCVGGAEKMLQGVAERLVARGHQVSILTLNAANQKDFFSARGSGLAPAETINGVEVRRFAPDNPAARALRSWTRLRGGWRSASALLGDRLPLLNRQPSPLSLLPALLSTRSDVVLSVNWLWPVAFAAHLARRLRRFPLVGVPILHIARPWAGNPIYPRMFSRCDSVITMTSAEARFVQDRSECRVDVGGTGVDPSRFERRDGGSLRAAHNLGTAPVVGFVGRQDSLKGATTLIEAMVIVWETRPDAFLLLAGQRSHRTDEVKAALERLPPAERRQVIDLPDFTDEQGPSIMDACDVLALPSVEEAFGMVYLEAWMCRRPVVGARIPSSECVIDEGGDGLLARPMDRADLARCLLELLGDPERCRAMGERGYAKTVAQHTWEQVTDRWERTLAETVEAGRRQSKGVDNGGSRG